MRKNISINYKCIISAAFLNCNFSMNHHFRLLVDCLVGWLVVGSFRQKGWESEALFQFFLICSKSISKIIQTTTHFTLKLSYGVDL